MVVKINVSISKDMLERLDDAARSSNTSRSALLSQAVKHYLEEREAEKQRKQQLQAVKTIDRVREEFGPWDGTAEVIKWRSRH